MPHKAFKANQIVDVRWKSRGAQESDNADEREHGYIHGWRDRMIGFSQRFRRLEDRKDDLQLAILGGGYRVTQSLVDESELEVEVP
jgi:hypothetical protein